VSGTVLTVQLALEYGLACNLAGGTHHAHRDFGSGFTILNDLAVATRAAQQREGVGKVVILDTDVHQVVREFAMSCVACSFAPLKSLL
jgi:acetoin utilization deacetylase AcuC-like enzyme